MSGRNRERAAGLSRELSEYGYLLGFARETLSTPQPFETQNETRVYRASGPCSSFFLSRKKFEFPLEMFWLGETRGHVQRFAYRYKNVGDDVFENADLHEYPIVAVTSLHIDAHWINKYGMETIGALMRTLVMQSDNPVMVLGGLGAADVYALVFDRSISNIHKRIMAAIREITIGELSLGKEALPDSRVLAGTYTTICRQMPANPAGEMHLKISNTDATHWAAINCSIQPGALAAAGRVLAAAVKESGWIEGNRLQTWVTNGNTDIKFGIEYGENDQLAIDRFYDNFLEINRQEGRPLHYVQLEYESQIDVAVEVKPPAPPLAETYRESWMVPASADISRALEKLKPALSSFVYQAVINAFNRYNELLRHPVAGDCMVAHAPFIRGVYEVLTSKDSPFDVLPPDLRDDFLAYVLEYINESMYTVETMDDYNRSVFDRFVVSVNGMHKVIEACYSVQYSVWRHAVRLFNWRKHPVSLMPLNILAPESRVRSKIFGGGLIVFRVGMINVVHFTNAIKFVRHVAKLALRINIVDPPHNADLPSAALESSMKSSAELSLRGLIASKLQCPEEKVQKFAAEALENWIRQCCAEQRFFIQALWGRRELRVSPLYGYLLDKKTVVEIAGDTNLSRMTVMRGIRDAVDDFKERLRMLRHDGPEIFIDVFTMTVLALEPHHLAFIKAFEMERSHVTDRTEVLRVLGVQLLGALIARDGGSHFVPGIVSRLRDHALVENLARVYEFEVIRIEEICRTWLAPLTILANVFKGPSEQMEPEDGMSDFRDLIDGAARRFEDALATASPGDTPFSDPEIRRTVLGEQAFVRELGLLLMHYEKYRRRFSLSRRHRISWRNLRGRHSVLNTMPFWNEDVTGGR